MKPFIILLISSFALSAPSPFFKKGVVLVQYNAEFNKSNNLNLSKISDAKVIDAWIDGDAELKDYGKVRSVPTIVLYQDQKEIKRWEADLSMTLKVDVEDIQEEVDKITGVNKF